MACPFCGLNYMPATGHRCGRTKLSEQSDSVVATPATLPDKTYLGDAIYAEWDYGDLVLTTENGIRTTNRIVLEPEVIRAALDYLRRSGWYHA